MRQLEGQFNMMLDVSKKFCFSVTVDPDGPCNKLYVLVTNQESDMIDW